MLSISEQNLRDIEGKIGRSLVGEILHQIEVVESQQFTKEESFSLLKSLIKNKIYESLRQHTALINQFSNGVTFTIDFIHTPKV